MANAVDAVLKMIKDQHKLDIQELGDSEWPVIERVSSGSLGLDAAIGGGWPRGRFVEIFGPQSGGKTLLSLLAIREAQKLGGRCAFFDVEHSFDPVWAETLGVDVDKLFHTQPDYGEQALEAIKMLADSNTFDVIVLDSIAELLPKAEIESPMEKMNMALQARMMSQCLRKLGPAIGKSKTIGIFINQTRATMAQYGAATDTPGGNAMKFYASLRVQVSRVSNSDRLDSRKNISGHDINVKVIKNKTAPPFRTATIPLSYTEGVIEAQDFANAMNQQQLFVFSGGVKYKGTSVKSLKDSRWAKWDDFHAWLIDPANAPTVAELKSELRNGSNLNSGAPEENTEVPNL